MNEQIIVNSRLISYIRAGEMAEGDSVLFLHGWRSNKEVWNEIIKKLNNKVFAIDFPGFGKSQTPVKAMGVGDYAEDVAQFITKLDLKNVIVVGHSFGGRVGIKLASKYPELISRLVLVDSAGFVMEQSKKNLIGILAKIAKPFFKPKFMQGLRKGIYKAIGAEDYLATPELQETFVKVTGEDLSEDMTKIKCSALILNGENDTDTPVEFGEKMHKLIKNSEFKVIAGAGHFSFIDKQNEFIKLLTNFIAK